MTTAESGAASAAGAVQLFCVAGCHGPRCRVPVGTSVVAFRDVAAVVKPHAYDLPGEQALDEYRGVVESTFRHQAVLPVPPGVVFRTRDVLAQWLELHYFTLMDALAFVDDRVVARVRVMRQGQEGATDADTEAVETALVDSLRILRRHAVATVEITDENGTAELNETSYLVEREQWSAFAEMVEAEDRRHETLTIQCTGPWPPYDFVRMQFGS